MINPLAKIPFPFNLLLPILVYVFVAIPILDRIINKWSVVYAYPLFVIAIGFLGYLIGRHRNLGLKLFLIVVIGYTLTDILSPPLLIPYSGYTNNLVGQQQLMGDVFLYTLYTGWGFNHVMAWVLTYLLTPLLLVTLMAMEMKGSALSRHLPIRHI